LNDVDLSLYEIILIEEKYICGNAQYEYSVVIFIIINIIDYAVNDYNFSDIILVLKIIIYFITVRVIVLLTACDILKTLTYVSVIKLFYFLVNQIEKINNNVIVIIANYLKTIFELIFINEINPHFYKSKYNENLFNESYYRNFCVSVIK
jgi:hypothetical protein